MSLDNGLSDFDLNQHLASYTGRSKLARLLRVIWYASRSETSHPDIRETALSLVLPTLYEIPDTALYLRTMHFLDAECNWKCTVDEAWLKTTRVQAFEHVTSLIKKEDELVAALNNQTDGMFDIRLRLASTRFMIGKEYRKLGTPTTALQFFKAGTRHQTARLIAQKWLEVFEMYVEHETVLAISETTLDLPNLSKDCRREIEWARNTLQDSADEGEAALTLTLLSQCSSLLTLLQAMGFLDKGEFREGAMSFLAHAEVPCPTTKTVLPPRELTLYTCFCVLSIRSESSMVAQLMRSAFFAPHLAESPFLVGLVRAVQDGHLREVLSRLSSISSRLSMDRYIYKHAHVLGKLIADSTLLNHLRKFKEICLRDLEHYTGIPIEGLTKAISGYQTDSLITGELTHDGASFHMTSAST